MGNKPRNCFLSAANIAGTYYYGYKNRTFVYQYRTLTIKQPSDWGIKRGRLYADLQ